MDNYNRNSIPRRENLRIARIMNSFENNNLNNNSNIDNYNFASQNILIGGFNIKSSLMFLDSINNSINKNISQSDLN